MNEQPDECRWCSKPLAEHIDSRGPNEPFPKVPCQWLKENYVARVFAPEPAAPKPLELNAQYPILQYFEWEHLPARLAGVSRPFCDLAHALVAELPRSPEVTAALRKLLEAKDCAVRAAL
jgi:hypothetical protein